MTQIRSLQILRFIAAAGVTWYHTHTAPNFGGAGVDIFFVLSGFIIAMLLANPRQTPADFARGRLTRVVPLYWAITLLLFAAVLLRPALFHTAKADPWVLVRSMVFIEQTPLLQVGWTLNYEMFFYTLATLCLVFRFRAVTLIAALSVAFIAGYAFGSSFLSNSRMLEFALGVLVFEAIRKQWLIPTGIAFAGLVAGFAILITAEFYDPSAYPLLRFGLPAALIVWSAVSLERFVGKGVTWLIVLGDASYATYLTHTFVIGFCQRYLPAGLVNAFVMVVIASGVGLIVYWAIDRPLMNAARYTLAKRTTEV